MSGGWANKFFRSVWGLEDAVTLFISFDRGSQRGLTFGTTPWLSTPSVLFTEDGGRYLTKVAVMLT